MKNTAYSSINSGQALLIILLVLAIGITIVLSLVARSITDVSITTREKESARAFSVAEAGVERALITGETVTGSIGEANYTATVTSIGEGSEYAPYIRLFSGDTFPVWFVSHAASGALTCSDDKCFSGTAMQICWGENGTDANSATVPAIEVIILYLNTPGDYATSRVVRAVYDPNASRRSINSFASAGVSNCQIADRQFPFSSLATFSELGIPSTVYSNKNGLQSARIRMLYNTDKPHGVGIRVYSPTTGVFEPSSIAMEEKTLSFRNRISELLSSLLSSIKNKIIPSVLASHYSGISCSTNNQWVCLDDGYYYCRDSVYEWGGGRTCTGGTTPAPASAPGRALLPPQGKLIESVGTTSDATRKIRVFQIYPDLPPIFDFAVFSTGGLEK